MLRVSRSLGADALSEVALDTGFADQAHFSRAVQSHFWPHACALPYAQSIYGALLTHDIGCRQNRRKPKSNAYFVLLNSAVECHPVTSCRISLQPSAVTWFYQRGVCRAFPGGVVCNDQRVMSAG